RSFGDADALARNGFTGVSGDVSLGDGRRRRAVQSRRPDPRLRRKPAFRRRARSPWQVGRGARRQAFLPAVLHASRGPGAGTLWVADLSPGCGHGKGPPGVGAVHDLLIRHAALLAVLTLAGQNAADRDRAVAELHRRAETVAPGSPDARVVAAGLAKLGRQYLSEDQTGRAVELLGEALALDDRNGLVLAELTLAFVRSGDLESARFYL